MDVLLSQFNATCYLVFATVCFWAAIDEKFDTGVMMTVGLSLSCIGAAICAAWEFNGLTPEDIPIINRAQAVLHWGMISIFVGYVWKSHSAPRKLRRRRTDFMQLD